MIPENDYEDLGIPLPDYEWVMFVDESGDVGLRTKAQGDKGSTTWFSLGAVVIHKNHEHEAPGWVRSILSELSSRSPELHYNTLDRTQRIRAAQMINELPMRAFVLMSHKENMRGRRNPRAAAASIGQAPFYNFCLRVLLERVTETIAQQSMKHFKQHKLIKVVIAKTGGVYYSQTRAYVEYLRQQAFNKRTYLDTKVIEPRVLSWKLVMPVSAKNTAGCQLADAITGAFYNAVMDTGSLPHLQEPAKSLGTVMATKFGKVSHHGLTLLPWGGKIPEKYRPIFEHYGFGWQIEEGRQVPAFVPPEG